jgi:hypothetical protein
MAVVVVVVMNTVVIVMVLQASNLPLQASRFSAKHYSEELKQR